MTTLQRSRYELVERRERKGRKLVTVNALANVEFEPWKDDGEGLFPPDMDSIGITTRTAYAIMLQTKAQLIEADRHLQGEPMKELLETLFLHGEMLKDLAAMLNAAHTRLLCAASVNEVADARVKRRAKGS